MKNKFSTLLLILFLSFRNQAQNIYLNIPATGLSNMSEWMLQGNINYGFKNISSYEAEKNPSPASTAGSVTASWQKFTGSHSIYSFMNESAKALQYHDGLNIVSFIHTKNTTYTSSPGNGRGDVVAMISSNYGLSWDSTCIWNDTTKRAFFPQGGIYNPPGNTNIANAFVVGTGAAKTSSLFSGNFYASKEIGPGTYNNAASTASNATQFFSNATPPPFGKHDMSCQSFCITNDGVARSLALLVNDINATTNTGYGLTGAMLVQGNFSGGSFSWSGQTFTPNIVARTDGSLQMANKVLMAWNNAGNVGYIVLIGAQQTNTLSNRGWQPIVYRTTNSGASWTQIPSINFNSPFYQSLKNQLKPVATNTNLVIPHFNIKEGIDATVDYNGALHIATTLVGTASEHNDSLDYTYLFRTPGYQWPHVTGAHPYLYDFVTNGTHWTYAKIDSLSSEIPGYLPNTPGYDDNPSDTIAGGYKISSGARIQLSRTPDGSSIIYTYAESDTNFTQNSLLWNVIPNIKAKAYLVFANNVLNDKIKVTNPPTGGGSGSPNVNSRAYFHLASPLTPTASGFGGGIPGWCLTPNEVFNVHVPMTVSHNLNPSWKFEPQEKISHWFSMVKLTFGGNNGYNSFPPYDGATGLLSRETAPEDLLIFPNPARNYVNIKTAISRSENVGVKITDINGKIIFYRESQSEFDINTEGLNNGVYLVSFYQGDNFVGMRKLVVMH